MSQLPPPAAGPAGWYPDPITGAGRYFDGYVWQSGPGGPVTFELEQVERHPDLPLRVAIGALAILVVSLVVGKFTVDALIDRGWPLVVYIAISAALSYGPSIGWLFYVRRRWGGGRFASTGWRFRWIDLAWGPAAWLSAIGIQLVLAAVVLLLDVPLSSNVDAISEADADRAYLVATAIAAVVAAPIVEELIFRGLVLRGLLSRLGPVLAIALQGVLFGVAHVDPVRGAGNVGLAVILSGVGVALGTAAYLTRRLGPSVIAHAIFNGVVVTILLTGVLDDIDTELSLAPAESAELHVVDQADLAEPGRRQDRDGAVDPLDRTQRRHVDQVDVLDRGTGFGLDDPAGDAGQRRRIAFAGGVGVGGGAQSA